jgi:hypothetical protein
VPGSAASIFHRKKGINGDIEELNKHLETAGLGQEIYLTGSPLESEEYYTNPDNPDYEGQVKCSRETYLGL